MSADEEIRASSVLPADRRALEIVTGDGLRLIGELALPCAADPAATLVCVHPLPTHGGMMDSHVLRKASWRLPALARIGVLRFNTRGTTSAAGTSEGSFDEARSEGRDLDAAIAVARDHGLPRIWLLGWSFGCDVILKRGPVPGIDGVILVSPALRYTTADELGRWSGAGIPLVCLIPENDDYLQPPEARERFGSVPEAEIVVGEGAGHLWVGEPYVRMVLDEVAGRLTDTRPLPDSWPAARAASEGPMERWSDL